VRVWGRSAGLDGTLVFEGMAEGMVEGVVLVEVGGLHGLENVEENLGVAAVGRLFVVEGGMVGVVVGIEGVFGTV
jgi:hypothetical protein